MKISHFTLILFILSIIIWPQAIPGLILIFCIFGVITLTYDKYQEEKKDKKT